MGDRNELYMRWLKISPTDEHVDVSRHSRAAMEGVAIKQATTADLVVQPGQLALEGSTFDKCNCYDTNAENPLANLPGCDNPAHRCCVSGCLGRLQPTSCWAPAGSRSRLSYMESADGLSPPSYLCQGCREEAFKAIEILTKELEVLGTQEVHMGLGGAAAVALLKAAHALKPSSPDVHVNTHLHVALHERVAELQE